MYCSVVSGAYIEILRLNAIYSNKTRSQLWGHDIDACIMIISYVLQHAKGQ